MVSNMVWTPQVLKIKDEDAPQAKSRARGADSRRRRSANEIVAILEAVDAEMESSGKSGALIRVANAFRVPEGNMSRWWQSRERIEMAAQRDRTAKMMGKTARRLWNARKHINRSIISGGMAGLACYLREMLALRKRRVISVPFLQRLARPRLN